MEIKLDSDEYTPSEDTFFIAENIQNEHGLYALDVGSGSGYLTRLLGKNFSFVVGTDINYMVLKDQTYKTENILCCNGSDALKIKFDLIICNMPYLATSTISDIATDGGKAGFEIPKKIIDSVFNNMQKNTKFIFVTSTLSDYMKLINYTKNLGLDVKIIARKKLFFEELILICASH